MKILMLNYEYPPLGGGAGRICQNISEHLVLQGHRVTVLTTWYEGLNEFESAEQKPTIIRLRAKRKKLFQSNPFEMYDWVQKGWAFLQNHLLNESYDLVFANFTIPGGWLAQKVKKKFRIPFCVISHGHDVPWFYKKQMFFYHLLTFIKIKQILNEATYLFVQSNVMRRNAELFLGSKQAKKIVQIPNGVKNVPINPEVRQKSYFSILFVGRLVKQKNPMLFLKAMKRLTRMQIPYHAYMIGDGKLRRELEKWIIKYKLNHVKITGWLNDEEVWQYYEKSHVMVMPSEIEGMSISNLEALSAGLYLLATPVSGNPEMLKCCANGELVASNDRDIANAIQRFYFEQYLKKEFISEKKRQQFINTFNWSTIVREYEKYLLTMINRSED